MSDVSRGPNTYPRCCFNLSPTYNAWCMFRVADIRRLRTHPDYEGNAFSTNPSCSAALTACAGQDIYFYNNLPVRWVRIVGIVVAIDEFSGRRVFTVDDSSGACIETVTPYTTRAAVPAGNDNHSNDSNSGRAGDTDMKPYPYAGIDVGSVVDVKGGLTAFRKELQISIERMVVLSGTTEELALWEKRAKFQRDVLGKPWILDQGDIMRCREEAEQEERAAERKARRLREAIAQTSLDHKNAYRSKPAMGKKQPVRERESESPERLPRNLRELVQRGDLPRGHYSTLGL
ncbi:hypothetical protein GMORB2_0802 [Geosmithia morbida]|uniref:CST complex subunit Stn1 N-terminal domain-containing protein n=1 Tax=Geosmithia morbida TaxID=1094350 RepID=A0A9P4YYR7_9HYPO|nr:uncharacterized protein GMORB2_0802 [Geosmithia morbida]KAF4125558.1 hypothetical protein GMORB2_0802 [Geosmithia morbida]